MCSAPPTLNPSSPQMSNRASILTWMFSIMNFWVLIWRKRRKLDFLKTIILEIIYGIWKSLMLSMKFLLPSSSKNILVTSNICKILLLTLRNSSLRLNLWLSTPSLKSRYSKILSIVGRKVLSKDGLVKDMKMSLIMAAMNSSARLVRNYSLTVVFMLTTWKERSIKMHKRVLKKKKISYQN